MKSILPVLFSMFCLMTATAQSSAELEYKAYLSNDATMALWEKAVLARQESADKKTGNDSLTYALALARFGLMNATMRNRDEDTFDKYYESTEKMLEGLTKRNSKWAEPLALLSAVYGLKMAYSSLQGMILGPKSTQLVDKAKQLDARSSFVWKVYANSKFFTPEMFGGDIDEAISAYKKSIQLYEAKPEQLSNNWFYIDALAFLGQAYVKKGNKAEAIKVYERALKAEPGFDWVKRVLLPKAQALQ